jgi:hypothetical protein
MGQTDHLDGTNGSPRVTKGSLWGDKGITHHWVAGERVSLLTVIVMVLLVMDAMVRWDQMVPVTRPIEVVWLLTFMVMVVRAPGIQGGVNKKPATGADAPGRADVWTQAVQWYVTSEENFSWGLFHTSVVQVAAPSCPPESLRIYR